MVNKTVEVRNGLKYTFSVPATPEEYISAANRGPSAILDDALDTNIYRTGLPDGWDQLAKAIIAEFKIGKLTKPHPKAERAAKGETVVNETDPAFVDRAAAQLVADGKFPDEKSALAKFQLMIDSFGVLPLDLTERRGGGGPSIGKRDMEMAATYLDAGPEKLNRALAKIAEATGNPLVEITGNRDEDQKNVALAIKAYRESQVSNLIK